MGRVPRREASRREAPLRARGVLRGERSSSVAAFATSEKLDGAPRDPRRSPPWRGAPGAITSTAACSGRRAPGERVEHAVYGEGARRGEEPAWVSNASASGSRLALRVCRLEPQTPCRPWLPDPLPRMSAVELDCSKLVVVTGGGGFIGGHLVAELERRGHERIRAVDIKPLDRGTRRTPRSRTSRPTCVKRQLLSRPPTARRRLQPRRRHGRHGLHRDAQGRLHGVGAHQHEHAARVARQSASSTSFSVRRRVSTRPTSRPTPMSRR